MILDKCDIASASPSQSATSANTGNDIVFRPIMGDMIAAKRPPQLPNSALAVPNKLPKLSNFIGVRRATHSWSARIEVQAGVRLRLGPYKSEEVAAFAYDAALIASGRKNYSRNFPQEEFIYCGSNSPEEIKAFAQNQVIRKYSIDAIIQINSHRTLDRFPWEDCLECFYLNSTPPVSSSCEEVEESSKFIGIYERKPNVWRAQMHVSKKPHYLGSYRSPQAAAFAYDLAAVAFGVGGQKRNFPQEEITYSKSKSIDNVKAFIEQQVAIKYPDNIIKHTRARTPFTGIIEFKSNKWGARAGSPNRLWLGQYNSAEAAAWAYDVAATALGLESVKRNFPQDEIVYSGSKCPKEVKQFTREQVALKFPNSLAFARDHNITVHSHP